MPVVKPRVKIVPGVNGILSNFSKFRFKLVNENHLILKFKALIDTDILAYEVPGLVVRI